MSIHKLTAGSGYDYLTRQVAALDATDKGHTGLSSYYTQRGEAPGVWVGSGMVGIDGLDAGDVVTAEQMQALFGSGFHPLAGERTAPETLFDADLPTRLGAPFKVYAGDVGPFRAEVAKRIAALNASDGLPPTGLSPWTDGPWCAPLWPASSSLLSTAGNLQILGRSRPRSPSTPGPRRPRSRGMT